MRKEFEKSIKKTHNSIQKQFRSIRIDSLEVAKQVEEYRQFWKPNKINVILLAESHVYTDRKDYDTELNKFILNRIIPDYPTRFVRFVYCLGYGENKLLTKKRTDRKNTGTPQFWKIFSSCVSESEDNLGFNRILKTRTPNFFLRLRNKVEILQKMKDKGIWLLDASIVGLYGGGSKRYNTIKKILEICWKSHIANIIEKSSSRHIIVIGKRVANVLSPKIRKLDIPFSVIPQPRARGTGGWQLENYKHYQRICSKY